MTAVDTSAEAVERDAVRLERMAAIGDDPCATECAEMAKRLRALAAERDAAQRGRDIVIENNVLLRRDLEADRDRLAAENARLLKDLEKVRRFLRISREEGGEALAEAERFKQERDEARRAVHWMTLFGKAADAEAEYRAALTGDTRHD